MLARTISYLEIQRPSAAKLPILHATTLSSTTGTEGKDTL